MPIVMREKGVGGEGARDYDVRPTGRQVPYIPLYTRTHHFYPLGLLPTPKKFFTPTYKTRVSYAHQTRHVHKISFCRHITSRLSMLSTCVATEESSMVIKYRHARRRSPFGRLGA
jgi:hypothetical protein